MRILCAIIFTCNSFFVIVQTSFLTFDFAVALGNESTWNSNSTNSSIQNPSVICRGSGLTAHLNAGRFNSNNFTTSTSIEFTDYLEFAITPATNYSINISQITIQSQRSSTGPQYFVIRTSIDNYVSNVTNVVTISGTSLVTNVFTFINSISTNALVSIRIYGYGATSGSGTWGPGSGGGNDIVVAGPGNVLPLVFGTIYATDKAEGVQLKWTTYQEVNVSHFEVEHSNNGSTFRSIGRVNALNRLGECQYNFFDPNVTIGTNFYRVKAIDNDGKIQSSRIIHILKEKKKGGLSIFPNPIINHTVSLYAADLNEGYYQLSIFNAGGQVIFKEKLFVEKRGLRISKQLSTALNKGMFFVQLSSNEFCAIKSFLVQ